MTLTRQWTMIRLGGGMLAAALLVALGAMGQTGGLRDQLLMGDGPQHAEARRPRGIHPWRPFFQAYMVAPLIPRLSDVFAVSS
jgi:hypothetical protein